MDEINLDELELTPRGFTMSYLMKNGFYDNFEISDEIMSWVVNPPPIYAAAGDDIKKKAKKHAKEYVEKKDESLKITRLIKNQFYEFMCTESEYYQKERSTIGGNINAVIAGLAATIAARISETNIGVVTSFVVCFIMVAGKMSKRAMCEYCKPE